MLREKAAAIQNRLNKQKKESLDKENALLPGEEEASGMRFF